MRVKARRGRDGEEVPIEVWAYGNRAKMVKELVVPLRPKEMALYQILRVQLQELGYDPRSDVAELVGQLKNVGRPVFHPPQTERINVEERGALLRFLYG